MYQIKLINSYVYKSVMHNRVPKPGFSTIRPQNLNSWKNWKQFYGKNEIVIWPRLVCAIYYKYDGWQFKS